MVVVSDCCAPLNVTVTPELCRYPAGVSPAPVAVDPSRVKASYKDGILTIDLAKAEEAKPKHIEVSVS